MESNTGIGKEKVIQELITHINSVEQKINMLKEELEEQNDLQTVNRLDIINIRNELEKIRMSVPTVSPDFAEKMKNVQKVMEKDFDFGNIQKIAEDIENLKKAMNKSMEETEEIRGEMSFLSESNRNKTGKVSVLPDKDISFLQNRVKELEDKTEHIKHCKKCGSQLKPGARFCGKCGKKV